MRAPTRVRALTSEPAHDEREQAEAGEDDRRCQVFVGHQPVHRSAITPRRDGGDDKGGELLHTLKSGKPLEMIINRISKIRVENISVSWTRFESGPATIPRPLPWQAPPPRQTRARSAGLMRQPAPIQS